MTTPAADDRLVARQRPLWLPPACSRLRLTGSGADNLRRKWINLNQMDKRKRELQRKVQVCRQLMLRVNGAKGNGRRMLGNYWKHP